MQPWTGATVSLAVVVRMVQVSTASPGHRLARRRRERHRERHRTGRLQSRGVRHRQSRNGRRRRCQRRELRTQLPEAPVAGPRLRGTPARGLRVVEKEPRHHRIRHTGDEPSRSEIRESLKGRTRALEDPAVEHLARGLSVRDIEDAFREEGGRLLLSRSAGLSHRTVVTRFHEVYLRGTYDRDQEARNVRLLRSARRD